MNYTQLKQVLDSLFAASFHDDVNFINICLKSAAAINNSIAQLEHIVNSINEKINQSAAGGARDTSEEQSELVILTDKMKAYEPQQRIALDKFQKLLREMHEQVLIAQRDPGDPSLGNLELTPEQRTDTVVQFASLGVDIDKSMNTANIILGRLSSPTEEPVTGEPVGVEDSYNPYVDYMHGSHKSY
jgi:hypothetical protein